MVNDEAVICEKCGNICALLHTGIYHPKNGEEIVWTVCFKGKDHTNFYSLDISDETTY